MRRIDALPQVQLVHALRRAIDDVRITDPLRGPSPAARRRLRKLINENPHSVRAQHVHHNIGQERSEWVIPLIEDCEEEVG